MKCECFRKDTELYFSYDSFGKPVRGERTIGICLGTKEMEQCFCEGDKDHCSLVKIEPVKDNYQRLIESSQDEIADFLADLAMLCYEKGVNNAGETISFEEKEDIARDLSEVLHEWLNNKRQYMKLFCLGLFVGANAGFLFAGLCHAAKDKI